MAGTKRTYASRKPSNGPKGSKEPVSSLVPATTRCLAIPEIVITVLSLCSKSDLAHLARTCRHWSACALDQLWEELDSIVPLLVLVRPLRLALETEYMSKWEFDGNAADADCNRFREYASRVRSLKYDENDPIFKKENSFIAVPAIQGLAVVHPFGSSLLPELQRLSWCCNSDETGLSILPFLSPSLHDMYLDIELSLSAENFQRLLRSLAHRTPELQNFCLSTRHNVSNVNDALVHFFRSTPKLRSVAVPQYYHTPELLGTLGRLEGLEGLETDWLYTKPQYVEKGTALLFPRGSFSALKRLHFHSSLELATLLLKNAGPISQLNELGFSSRKFWPSKSLKNFLLSIGRACPYLEVLLLNFCEVATGDDTPDDAPTFETIRPCLSLTRLRELKVGWDLPFYLEDADVWVMSQAWKNLRILRLSSDPDSDEVPHLTSIAILQTFSQAMPDLEYLSLYFDQQHVPRFTPHLELRGGFRFRLELDVGNSAVPDGEDHAIGFFIGSLCQQCPTITATQTHWTESLEFVGPEEEEIEKWARVEKLTGMICESRRAMKTTIETLRSRVATLEQMIGPPATS
ncbi:hypothetical protein FRB90_005962 [Tulasnella sp. 427]|nr:hypothetical protein FRB90_005962 [Tulasnella sp. 427]